MATAQNTHFTLSRALTTTTQHCGQPRTSNQPYRSTAHVQAHLGAQYCFQQSCASMWSLDPKQSFKDAASGQKQCSNCTQTYSFSDPPQEQTSTTLPSNGLKKLANLSPSCLQLAGSTGTSRPQRKATDEF